MECRTLRGDLVEEDKIIRANDGVDIQKYFSQGENVKEIQGTSVKSGGESLTEMCQARSQE